jgi:hypothetical protein
VYGPSLTPVAQVDEAGTVEYLHGDLLGSVRSITDSSGAVVGASTFDAFGSRAAHTGAADSAFGFTGGWTDPVTGLVHLRARDAGHWSLAFSRSSWPVAGDGLPQTDCSDLSTVANSGGSQWTAAHLTRWSFLRLQRGRARWSLLPSEPQPSPLPGT